MGLFSLHLPQLSAFGNCQTNKPENDDLNLFLSLSPFLLGGDWCSTNEFQRLVLTRVPVCAAAPGSHSRSSTRAVETMALKLDFALWFRNTEAQPCRLLHVPRPPPDNPCWWRTGNLAGLRQHMEVPILADKRWGPERM